MRTAGSPPKVRASLNLPIGLHSINPAFPRRVLAPPVQHPVKAGDEEICGAQFTQMGDDAHARLAEFVMAELKDLIDSKHD